MRQNKQIQRIEDNNISIELKIKAPYFNKIVVTDPIILFQDQWERLKHLAREIVPAGEQTPIDKLYEQAIKEGKPICWTQLAAKPLRGEELIEKIKDADAIVACWTALTDDVLICTPKLRYVGYWTHQVLHRINFELANSLNIHIDHVPDYGTSAVASQTLLGTLAILRNLPEEVKLTKEGRWHHELLKTRQRVPLTEEQIPQSDLWFKNVGIVGWGPIGRQFAKLLEPFECDISYWSRTRRSEEEEKQYKVTFRPLELIFKDSDIVSIHLNPYAGEKMISRELIYSMQNGSIFINTSAGGLVDQQALFERLKAKEIRSYLDVYEGLPPKSEIRELLSMGNIFTYRAAWFTKEAIRLKAEKLLRNMEKYISENLVNVA